MYDENDPTQRPAADEPVPFTADGRRQPGQGGIDMGAVLASQNVVHGSEVASGGDELAELNQRYPVEKLCGPASMQTIKEGVTGLVWMKVFNSSPFYDSGWEVWLGGYVWECIKKGEWGVASEQPASMQKAVQVDMFRQVSTVSGDRFAPTDKLCKFVSDRLGRYTN